MKSIKHSCVILDAKMTTMRSNRSGGTAKRDEEVRPLVVCLSYQRRPFAILWAVVSIVILAVNGVAIGALSHIGKEVQEFQPAFANLDAAPAVVFESGELLVIASSEHDSPYAVGFWKRLSPASEPVFNFGRHNDGSNIVVFSEATQHQLNGFAHSSSHSLHSQT